MGKKARRVRRRKATKKARRARRRAARAANKRARGGRTIAQCVVAAMKAIKKPATMAAIAKKLASQKIKVASFVLAKVMARLQKQRVVRKSGASFKLTGKAIPKPMSKAAALRKARAALKRKAKKGKGKKNK